MGRFKVIGTAAVMAVVLASGVQAESKTDRRVDNAIDVMHEFTSIPEHAIPPSLLDNAYGIAIVPGVIKVGLGFGGHFGKGVLMVRQDSGQWSNPTFIRLGGGSFGWQIGAKSTDLVLVFKDRRSIEDIAYGKITLGGNASVAAGPLGRQTSAATDGRLAAEIYSYSRSRGLFAGVSLEGAWLAMDRYANEEYYDSSLSPLQILDAANMPAPVGAQQLTQVLTASAPPLKERNVRQARAEIPASSKPATTAPAETYAIGETTTTGTTYSVGEEYSVGDEMIEPYLIEPAAGGGDATTF